MRIPYRWLREFVDTAAEPRAVAERLTMAGIETSLVAEGASELGGLIVAEVLAVAPHAAGGTLRICEVSTGAERYRVVCGAPNVRAGVRAAFAPPGATLPGGRRVAVATIRGVASEGMLCSEAELGVGPSSRQDEEVRETSREGDACLVLSTSCPGLTRASTPLNGQGRRGWPGQARP